MKTLFAVIASGLIVASAPGVSAPAVAGKSTAGEPPSVTKKPRSADTKYCLTYEALTGSRIPTRECKTRAQWGAEVVDVDKLLKA